MKYYFNNYFSKTFRLKDLTCQTIKIKNYDLGDEELMLF